MFENIENLKLMSVYEGISAQNAVFVNKPSHFMVYKLFGESEYSFDGKTFCTYRGDMILIPKGADYSVKKLNSGESRYIAVRFEADGIPSDNVPYRFPTLEGADAEDIFRTLNSLWIFGTGSKRMKCYSVFYGLLSALADKSAEYVSRSARNMLDKSMEYLEVRIFDPELSVEAMIESSGVSGTYFRKCFRSVYGVSPKEYICEKRLLHARSILDGGDFGSIADVARSVGYEDALYFGKVFKRKYGVSPSGYIG